MWCIHRLSSCNRGFPNTPKPVVWLSPYCLWRNRNNHSILEFEGTSSTQSPHQISILWIHSQWPNDPAILWSFGHLGELLGLIEIAVWQKLTIIAIYFWDGWLFLKMPFRNATNGDTKC
jgi:hypothetical protein